MESSQQLSSQPHHQMYSSMTGNDQILLNKYSLLTQQITPTVCQVVASQVKGRHPGISQEKAEGTR